MSKILKIIQEIFKPKNNFEIILRVFGIIGIFQLIGLIVGTYTMSKLTQIFATLLITSYCLCGTFNREE